MVTAGEGLMKKSIPIWLLCALPTVVAAEPEKLFFGGGMGYLSWMDRSEKESLHSRDSGTWHHDDLDLELSIHYFPNTIQVGSFGYGLRCRITDDYYEEFDTTLPGNIFNYTAVQNLVSLEYVYSQRENGTYVIPSLEFGEVLYDSRNTFYESQDSAIPSSSRHLGIEIKWLGGDVNEGSSIYFSLGYARHWTKLSESSYQAMLGVMF